MKTLLLSLAVLGGMLAWPNSSYAGSITSCRCALQDTLDYRVSFASPREANLNVIWTYGIDGTFNDQTSTGQPALLNGRPVLKSTAGLHRCCSPQIHSNVALVNSKINAPAANLITVPEPASLFMLGTGLLGIAALLRRTRLL